MYSDSFYHEGIFNQDESVHSWRPDHTKIFYFLNFFQTAPNTECEDALERAGRGLDKLPKGFYAARVRQEPSPFDCQHFLRARRLVVQNILALAARKPA
jgi:hypothetical protein